MADEKSNPLRNDSEVVETFRKLILEHKNAIRISVLEDLVESCYGPQALLNGQKITDIISFKEWLGEAATSQRAPGQRSRRITTNLPHSDQRGVETGMGSQKKGPLSKL
ncbi:MAG: hypothetical protein ACYDDS_19065 [Candidatus Sulfotelmatobacter sp.]